MSDEESASSVGKSSSEEQLLMNELFDAMDDADFPKSNISCVRRGVNVNNATDSDGDTL